jgi:hypothetical protein
MELDGSHLPAPPDQIRLSTPSSTLPFAHAQQPTGRHRFLGTFDAQATSSICGQTSN